MSQKDESWPEAKKVFAKMLAGRGKKLRWLQCFQMARLVFHIWPFATMKSCPKASKCAKVCSKLCHLLNKALKCSNKNLPKKQNFAKSGHKYAKVGSERCNTLNKPSRNGQNVLKHSKRGKNSTIPATLDCSHAPPSKK